MHHLMRPTRGPRRCICSRLIGGLCSGVSGTLISKLRGLLNFFIDVNMSRVTGGPALDELRPGRGSCLLARQPITASPVS